MNEKWEAECQKIGRYSEQFRSHEQSTLERAEMLAKHEADARTIAERDFQIAGLRSAQEGWGELQAEMLAEIERLQLQSNPLLHVGPDGAVDLIATIATARREAFAEAAERLLKAVAYTPPEQAGWRIDGVLKELRALAARGDEPGTSPKATFATCTCPARHTFDTGEGLNPHWSDCALAAKGDES